MAMELSVELGLEDSLKDCYQDGLLYEMADDPMEAIQKADAVEDVLMNIASTDEDIYYAFLKEALKGENYFNKTEQEENILNFGIAGKMLHANMDYQSIIRCMSYSPMFAGPGKRDFKKRWDRAVSFTCLAVNPVLSFTDTVQAKPLALLNIYADEPGEIYSSCLKTILYKMPNLTIQSADEEIVRLLLNAGCKEDDRLLRQVMFNSLNFNFSNSDNLVARHEHNKNVYEKLDKFLADAIRKTKEAPGPFKVKKLSDQEIYDDMQQKIRAMKELHEKGDGFQYWTTAINIISDTMARLQHLQNMGKTLNIWAVGLERASMELGLNASPDKELQANIKELLQSIKDVQEERKQWNAFWPLYAKIDVCSKELIKKMAEVQQQNPLMKLPEVQHAESLAEVVHRESIPANVLYFAALKDVVIKNPGVTQDEADNLVIEKLLTARRSEDDVMLAVSHSPCFRNLNRTQAMGASQTMVDAVAGKREPGSRTEEMMCR
ncbi:hypothetical protein [Anaerovibrio sp.]|uniref:hypothetical protein n=1 Tax=Anaerovibrio sp. TaxID=1872532 RepID=UPI003F17CF58